MHRVCMSIASILDSVNYCRTNFAPGDWRVDEPYVLTLHREEDAIALSVRFADEIEQHRKIQEQVKVLNNRQLLNQQYSSAQAIVNQQQFVDLQKLNDSLGHGRGPG